MQPWIIDRIEKQEDELTRAPLRIQRTPPDWRDEQRRDQEPMGSDRGVSILGGDEPTGDRGVFIINL